VQRDDAIIAVILAPRWDKGLERYLLGVQKSSEPKGEDIVIKKYPFFEALYEGSLENLRLAGLTFQVLGRLITGQLSYKSLGGPIRIAQASAAAAESGAAQFLFFMAFLSLQLGILNLLPIPVLDGGHLFFMGIEAIRRKPVSLRVQGVATQLGLFLLLFVMLIVTVNDIDVVWDWSQLLEKVKGLFS
jgi:regulator of sigma E protease